LRKSKMNSSKTAVRVLKEKMMKKFVKILIGLIVLIVFLVACAPAIEAPVEVIEPKMVEEAVAEEVEEIEEVKEVQEVEAVEEVEKVEEVDDVEEVEDAEEIEEVEEVEEPAEVADASYPNITVDTLKTMLDERPASFTLVNTYISFEKNIPNTDLTIPYNEILENLDKLPQDKDAEIVLYCMGGMMSRAALSMLVRAGYTNVKFVSGGFTAWSLAGYPLKRAP
jgi:rhodanese-related sulfurtransferase